MAEETAPAPAPVEVKSGIATSEFWLHLVVVVVGALISSGVIPHTGIVGDIVGGSMSIIGVTHWGYIRTKIKTIAIHAGAAAFAAAVADIKAADAETPATK